MAKATANIDFMKRFFLPLITAFALLSGCDSSDGNDRTPIEYRLLSGANQVTSITFKGANGRPATVSAENLSDHWTQRVWVVKPFSATATVALRNATASDQPFVLQIYVREQMLSTVADTLAAMSDTTATVSGSVAN